MSVTKLLAVATVASVNNADVTNFVEGLLDGLVQDNSFDNIAPCLKDAEGLDAELVEAVADFKKKDIMDIIKGVSVIGKMIGTVDVDIADCKSAGPDVKRIEVWAKIFKDPVALFKKVFSNSIMHISQIHTDIGSIITDASSKDFKDMGGKIADILVTAIGPIPKISEIEQYNYLGTCRSAHGDEDSCNADAACSWCKSSAVKSSCNELADARHLPKAVF
jgi:hypothetical protein